MVKGATHTDALIRFSRIVEIAVDKAGERYGMGMVWVSDRYPMDNDAGLVWVLETPHLKTSHIMCLCNVSKRSMKRFETFQ